MNFFKKENKKLNFQYDDIGTSLVVQWLRIHLAIQGMGLIPGQGTRSHMLRRNWVPYYWAHVLRSCWATTREFVCPRERSCMMQQRPNKDPQASTKTQCNQINKYLKNKCNYIGKLKVKDWGKIYIMKSPHQKMLQWLY